MLSQVFNKIYVIQSLGSQDKKTGEELYNDIIQKRAQNLRIDAEFKDLETPNEFIEYLAKISNEVQFTQIFPIIHIETHGDTNGLKLRSGYLVGANIIDLLVKINTSCKNNLFLTVAACKGAFIADRIIENLKECRAPFWGLMAPKENIGWPDLSEAFTGFYDELLRTLNIDLAIPKIDNRYEFYNCEQLFIEGFKLFKSKLNTVRNRQQSTEKLLTKLRQLPQYKDIEISEIRHKIKTELRDFNKENFEIMKRSFFMIDLYPENADRFQVDYNNLVANNNL